MCISRKHGEYPNIFALKRHVFDVGKPIEKKNISQSQRCGVLQDVTEKVFFSHQKKQASAHLQNPGRVYFALKPL